MGNKLEGQRKIGPTVKSANILLDKDDLLHLSLLRRFGGVKGIADPRKGLSIPNRLVNDDLQAVLIELSSAGRVRVSNETPKKIIAPSVAGNTVVRPLIDDESVLSAFTDINPGALDQILDLATVFGRQLKSVNLFPNYSSRELKGVAVEFDPGANRWWKDMARHRWPLGRGIVTAALPVDAEEFINHSEDILKIIQQIGQASEKAIKYVRFFYGENGQAYMTVSAGPTKAEREDISMQLANINRPSHARSLLNTVEEKLTQRRVRLIDLLVTEMGLSGSPELLSDAPYVGLDIDSGRAVSGGVGMKPGILPFSKRDDGLVIYHEAKEIIRPLGVKRIETKKPLPNFFSQQSINDWANTLDVVLELRDLVVGYHAAR